MDPLLCAIWGTLLLFSIGLAIFFAESVKFKIRNKETFNGAAWGLLNGLVGIGLLWVMIAHSSINAELLKVKDKNYREYVKGEMASFTKMYIACLIICAILSALIGSAMRSWQQ